MANFGTQINNLSWTVTNGVLAHMMGGALDKLQSLMANGGRDNNLHFYVDASRGGALYNVIARNVVGGVVDSVSKEAVSQYKVLIGGKSKKLSDAVSKYNSEQAKNAQEEEEKKYGSIKINDGKDTIEAKDDWGYVCCDALMLSIPVAQKVSISTIKTTGAYSMQETKLSDHLVWYDTTALINISSNKDLILTRVAGRDYSRKELVSNGDINFSVTGHITSKIPDIYPTNEVQKFRQIMQYKGIIEVNNQILDQWGVKKIVIKSFNLPSNEGSKAMQDYSFEAIGLQPETEANVSEDTVTYINRTLAIETESESLSWTNMLASQLENLKSISADLLSQGAALAGGMLDDAMAKNSN